MSKLTRRGFFAIAGAAIAACFARLKPRPEPLAGSISIRVWPKPEGQQVFFLDAKGILYQFGQRSSEWHHLEVSRDADGVTTFRMDGHPAGRPWTREDFESGQFGVKFGAFHSYAFELEAGRARSPRSSPCIAATA